MTTPATIENPRWLCSGCGAEYPMDGLAYPVCSCCGLRCRMPTADGLPYVGTPEERLAGALAQYGRTYHDWRVLLDRLRANLDEPPASDLLWAQWRERQLRSVWDWTVATASALGFSAVELDRVEREVVNV